MKEAQANRPQLQQTSVINVMPFLHNMSLRSRVLPCTFSRTAHITSMTYLGTMRCTCTGLPPLAALALPAVVCNNTQWLEPSAIWLLWRARDWCAVLRCAYLHLVSLSSLQCSTCTCPYRSKPNTHVLTTHVPLTNETSDMRTYALKLHC